jgi:hypothetical protein
MDQRVGPHHQVGLSDQARGLERQQLRVARPGADEVHHARRHVPGPTSSKEK